MSHTLIVSRRYSYFFFRLKEVVIFEILFITSFVLLESENISDVGGIYDFCAAEVIVGDKEAVSKNFLCITAVFGCGREGGMRVKGAFC